MTSFVIKLTLTPLLIAAVSLAGKKWGHGVSGWLAGLPLTSGPVSFFLAVEQGPRFAARAAAGTMAGVIAVAAYCFTYAVVAPRKPWYWSALWALPAYCGIVLVLRAMTLPLVWSGVALLAALALTIWKLPILPHAPPTPDLPWWNVPFRMVVAAALVVGLTAGASALGPEWSGLLSPFPIFATVLGAFTHHHAGAGATQRLLRGIVLGNVAFTSFFMVAGLTLGHWSLPLVYGVASLAAALTSLGTRGLVRPENA